MNGVLDIYKIKVTKNQKVSMHLCNEFHLKTWFSKAFRDPYTGKLALRDSELGEITFGLSKGLRPVYIWQDFKQNQEFYKMDMAVLGFEIFSLLSKNKDMSNAIKIRTVFGGPQFEYERIDK